MSSTPDSLVLHFSEPEPEAEYKKAAEFSRAPRVQFNSPLFNLMTILKAESNPLVASQPIQANTEKTAFLINIDSSTPHIPLLQHALKDRHFRIDQYCKTSEKSRHGLTPAHYTETYAGKNSAGEQEYVVVHGFLTAAGNLLYSEIKAYQDPERKILSPTQFSAKEVQELEQSLIVNINTSRTLLDSLMQEKKKRAADFKAEADKHEQELDVLSCTLHTKASLEQYIVVSQSLIQDITLFNQYSDIPDSRGKTIQKRLPFLTSRLEFLQALSQPKPTTVTQEDNEPAVNDGTEEMETPTDSILERLVQQTICTLETQQKKIGKFLNENQKPYVLHSPNFDKIIELQQIITETEEHLMLALCLPNTMSTQNKKKIDRLCKVIQAKIDKHYTQCLQVLNLGIEAANLEVIQKLFPVLETKLKKEFFEQLIDSLINCKASCMAERRQQLIEICDYFHNFSTVYNDTLLEISAQKTYETPVAAVPRLKDAKNAKDIKTIEVYLLFKVYLNNNLDVFEMLLRHGVDPDGATLQHLSKKRKFFTTIWTIASFNSENYLFFIKTLLQYNANPHLMYSREQTKKIHQEKLQNGVAFRKMIAPLPKDQGSKMALKNALKDSISLFPLVSLMLDRSTDLNVILPYTDINHLALLLSEIANDKIFCTRKTTTEQPAVHMCENVQAVDALIPQLSIKFQPYPFLTYVIYPTATSDLNTPRRIGRYIDFFKKAYHLLNEKMQSVSLGSDDFEKNYQELFTQAIDQDLEKGYLSSFSTFMACDFLLTVRYNTLTHTQEKSQLVQKYIPELCRQLFPIISKLFSAPHHVQFKQSWEQFLLARLEACVKWNKNPPQPALTFSGNPTCKSDITTAQVQESPQETENKGEPLKAKNKNEKRN